MQKNLKNRYTAGGIPRKLMSRCCNLVIVKLEVTVNPKNIKDFVGAVADHGFHPGPSKCQDGSHLVYYPGYVAL